MEGSGSTLGDSPWEGPSGPGSAGAAGLEDQRARNASARRARPGAAVAGRDLRGGPRHRSGAGRGAGGPWRAGGHGPLGGLQVRRPIGAGARLRGDAERDRGGGGRAAEGSPRPNHCGERGSPAPTNAQREGGPAPTNAAEEGEPARTNGLWTRGACAETPMEGREGVWPERTKARGRISDLERTRNCNRVRVGRAVPSPP